LNPRFFGSSEVYRTCKIRAETSLNLYGHSSGTNARVVVVG